MDVQISDEKDPFGDTLVRMVNHDEVIAQIREDVARSVSGRASAEGREPTAEEIAEIEAAVQSVPDEITIPRKALRRRRGGGDVEDPILSRFFPVHRPAGARIVQAHMCADQKFDRSAQFKMIAQMLRAQGIEDARIRTRLLTLAGDISQLDTENRDEKMTDMVRAIDEVLAEPAGTPPAYRAGMVKEARRMIAPIVKAARKEGEAEAALRAYLATYLADMTTKLNGSGVSAWLVGETIGAYRQAITEVLGPEDPPPAGG